MGRPLFIRRVLNQRHELVATEPNEPTIGMAKLGRPAALAFIDMNGLKQINDRLASRADEGKASLSVRLEERTLSDATER